MNETFPVWRLVLMLVLYLSGPILIMWLSRRFRFLSKVGTIVMAYALGIIMSLSGLGEVSGEGSSSLAMMKDILQTICVPLAIPLMLFSSDLRYWIKSLKSTLIAFFCGIVAITLAVSLSFFLFHDKGIPELDKAAALMVGFYTGGTPNVASLKLALQPSAETFLLVNTFEIFITFFFLAFLIGGGFRLVRLFLPYVPEYRNSGDRESAGGTVRSRGQREKDLDLSGACENGLAGLEKIETDDFENYQGMLSWKVWKPLSLALFCSILLCGIAGCLSWLFVSPDYRVVSVILIITTFSMGFSFWERLRKTPKMFELGMYFILVFSMVIASDFKLSVVTGGTALGLMAFISVVLVLSVSLHLLLAKVMKVDADLFTISAVGLIFSPPFVPAIAGLMKSRRCLISGIVVGLMGYAVGNYLGVALYMLINAIF